MIKRISLRFYEGEEDLVEAIEDLHDIVIVNQYLKDLIRDTLVKNETKSTHTAQPAPVDTESLAKELLPQIRRVIEAALAEHTIMSPPEESDIDEDAQQRIQEGLKKLGQSMM